MAEDVEVMQEKPSNACCAALKKKHSKLLEKFSKVEELKNKFRDCTALVQEKYDVIEKENGSLKKAFEELKVQASMWKDEKEQESGIRVDLEDEVSALRDEVQLLKRNSFSVSREEKEQLQGRLNDADKEMKKLKELLDKEQKRAATEKKDAEMEKKKADEALKKLDMEKNKVREAEKVRNIERKRAEENRLMWEKLKVDTNAVRSKLTSEKSKSETASKKIEVERQNALKERERAELAVAKAEEQGQLAEMNLKKAMLEKDRADDLNQKFEEASNRAKELEKELQGVLCSGKLVETQANISNTGTNAKLASEDGFRIPKSDAVMSQWMQKMLSEKEQTLIREKKRADSEKKIAKRQRKVAKDYKKMAREQEHRADKLSKELESCKLRLAEVQAELVKASSYKMYAKNSSLRYNNTISETDIVKQLKNQLNLEKMLVKNAKKASQLEAVRNNLLHQELLKLKQEFLQLQLHMSMLDNCFSHSGEGIHPLEKMGHYASTGETLFFDDCHEQLISGIDSELDPPHRGSNQTMLQSSAINSSSTSFSDRPFMGSQERGTLSVASAKLGEDISNIKPTIPRLSNKSRIRHNEHAVVKADNITQNSVKENAHKSRVGYPERKGVLDAVKSLENLYCKGEKLHDQVSEKLSLLYGILSDHKDKPEEENLKDNSCRGLDRPSKRRKISSEGTIVTHCLQENEVAKSMFDSDADHSNACGHASPQQFGAVKFDSHVKDVTKNVKGNCREPQDFDMMVGYDHMKLLDLDDAAAENSYRRAIAVPLSPLQPDIEFHVDQKLEDDNPQMLLKESSQEGLTNFMGGLLPSSNFRVHNIKVKPINKDLNGTVSSPLHANEDSNDLLRSKDSAPAGDVDFHQILISGGKSRMSDPIGFSSKETNILHGRGIASPHGGWLKYYVVFSDNKDNLSILRILQAIGTCMPDCSFLDAADVFVQSILQSLLRNHDLSMKEKVCVFFSLVLHRVSEVGMRNWSNVLSYDSIQSLDSAAHCISSALTNPVLRRKLKESCDLFELLALIEDFLLQGKVFVSGDESAHCEVVSSSKLDLVLNGDAITLSEVVASASLLVAGGSMFASLCSAVDHVGCVCEMSCNIITMQKCDPAMMLVILHTFAHICGSKYFALQQYSLPMAVIKALVMFLERQTLSTKSTSISLPSVGNISKIWSCCTNCPFSEGAVSMEDVALTLLENLHKHSQSVTWPEDSLDVVNALVCRGGLHGDRPEEVLGVREAVSLSSTFDENLCSFIDVLSLIELLASSMDWKWTFDHIIAQICAFLESCLREGFCAAVIVLLGQLGRLGVSASGYEDPRVKKLREWLSARLCNDPFRTFSLPVQFATVTSLFAITPTKFDQVIDDTVETPAVLSQYVPADFIREWFSQLTHEQQSLFKLSSGCVC